jgi:hypothetical protein
MGRKMLGKKIAAIFLRNIFLPIVSLAPKRPIDIGVNANCWVKLGGGRLNIMSWKNTSVGSGEHEYQDFSGVDALHRGIHTVRSPMKSTDHASAQFAAEKP